MKIFKAEQWNLEILLPLFEQYRVAHNMTENPQRTLMFLANRIRFNESIFFLAIEEKDSLSHAVGFVQLYPRVSSLRLQRYWQLADIFVQDIPDKNSVYHALIAKAKEFVRYTQANCIVVEQNAYQQPLLEQQGFKRNPQKSIFELNLLVDDNFNY